MLTQLWVCQMCGRAMELEIRSVQLKDQMLLSDHC